MKLAQARKEGLLTSDEVETAKALGITELPENSDALRGELNRIIAANEDAELGVGGNVLWAGFGIEILAEDMLPDFVVSLQQSDDRAVDELRMNRETWNTIVEDRAAYDELLDRIGTPATWQEWKEGPVVRAIVKDGGSFAAAAQRLRDAKQADKVDPLAELEAAIGALVTQASELRTQPSNSVASTLGLRLGTLREEHAELVKRLAELGAQLDFAAVAVVDAASLPARV